MAETQFACQDILYKDNPAEEQEMVTKNQEIESEVVEHGEMVTIPTLPINPCGHK